MKRLIKNSSNAFDVFDKMLNLVGSEMNLLDFDNEVQKIMDNKTNSIFDNTKIVNLLDNNNLSLEDIDPIITHIYNFDGVKFEVILKIIELNDLYDTIIKVKDIK